MVVANASNKLNNCFKETKRYIRDPFALSADSTDNDGHTRFSGPYTVSGEHKLSVESYRELTWTSFIFTALDSGWSHWYKSQMVRINLRPSIILAYTHGFRWCFSLCLFCLRAVCNPTITKPRVLHSWMLKTQVNTGRRSEKSFTHLELPCKNLDYSLRNGRYPQNQLLC